MKRRSEKKLDNISQYFSFLPDGINVKHDQFFKRSLEEIKTLRKQFIVKHVPEYVKSKVANNNGDYDLSIVPNLGEEPRTCSASFQHII